MALNDSHAKPIANPLYISSAIQFAIYIKKFPNIRVAKGQTLMSTLTVSQQETANQQKKGPSPQIWKWIRFMLIALPLLFITLGVITYLAGMWAKSNLVRQAPMPGQRIEVDGTQIHLNCIGEGSPTVIMESGLNDFSLHWAYVQPEVTKFAKVCTYDRAGLGWSQPSSRARTTGVIIDELHTVLTKAGLEGPYILVGHSFGGILVRAFAHQYPGEVVGMVLVDSAHENQLARLPAMHKAFDQLVQQFSLLGSLSSLGLIALSPDQIPNQGLPDRALVEYRALLATTNYFDAAAIESKAFRATLEETADLPLATLGDLPLIVLSRGQEDPSPALTATEVAQNAEAWQRMQAELAALSTQSQHIYAEQSGHYLQLQQPALVIDAIKQMIQTAQDGQRYSN